MEQDIKVRQLAESYLATYRRKKTLETELEDVRGQLDELLGERTKVEVDGYTVQRVTPTTKVYDPTIVVKVVPEAMWGLVLRVDSKSLEPLIEAKVVDFAGGLKPTTKTSEPYIKVS